MPREFQGKIPLDIRVKVVFDVADDAHVDVEKHLAAAMARD